jgi:hypothetical protein
LTTPTSSKKFSIWNLQHPHHSVTCRKSYLSLDKYTIENLFWLVPIAKVNNGSLRQKKCQCSFIILNKIRHGDHDVEISIPNVDRYKEHIPILVDDIISTGRTMIETITHLKNAGMKPPYLHWCTRSIC